ncbi:MAG: rod-binding protein [Thermodesulfobacteriota bacterium]
MGELKAIAGASLLKDDHARAGLKAQKLKKAVLDFEALFINEMLKNMRSTITKSGLLGDGMREDVYTSLFDWEISREMASGRGLGLGEMLIKGFKGNEGTVDKRPAPNVKLLLK